MKIRISLIQMDIKLGDPNGNREYGINLINEAVRRGSHIVTLPELWTTGYSLKIIDKVAEPLNGPTIMQLSNIASNHGIYIIGSFIERKDNKFYNTAPLIGPNGIIGVYKKIHLFKLMNEDLYFTPGDSFDVYQTNFGKIGIVICYDIRFPELIRSITLKGAKILFVVAEWPHPRMHHWRYLLMARAIENQIFVVATNRVGSDENNKFFGHSMIIDPMGEVLIESGEVETILTSDIELDEVDNVRSKFPFLNDRKPEFYKIL